MKGDGGTSTIGHGTADDDDPCGSCISSFPREMLADIRRCSQEEKVPVTSQ